MTEQLEQKMKEELLKLPKEIGEVVSSFSWDTETEKIGKKNLLVEEDIDNLQIETGLVLLGLENPDSYSLNIETNVGLSKKEAENISTDVFKTVFDPIFIKIAEKTKIDIGQEQKAIGDENWENNIDYILNN